MTVDQRLTRARRLVISARADLAKAAAALGIVLVVVGCEPTRHLHDGPLCTSVERRGWADDTEERYTVTCPHGAVAAEQTAVGAFIECRCHAADGGKL